MLYIIHNIRNKYSFNLNNQTWVMYYVDYETDHVRTSGLKNQDPYGQYDPLVPQASYDPPDPLDPLDPPDPPDPPH